MDEHEELKSLKELHEAGGMSDADFEESKARLMQRPPVEMQDLTVSYAEKQTRQWASILHFSQFAGYVVPLAGLIAPIVIWQIKKNDLPAIDAHGKIVANWMISAIIYAILSVILMIVLIGIPMLIALGLMAIIFPIIGGIKASNGELWKYPLSIPFFK